MEYAFLYSLFYLNKCWRYRRLIFWLSWNALIRYKMPFFEKVSCLLVCFPSKNKMNKCTTDDTDEQYSCWYYHYQSNSAEAFFTLWLWMHSWRLKIRLIKSWWKGHRKKLLLQTRPRYPTGFNLNWTMLAGMDTVLELYMTIK